MPSRRPTLPRLGESFPSPSIVRLAAKLTLLCSLCDSSGWNDYRGWTAYKDNQVNGAGLATWSCTKIYYFL